MLLRTSRFLAALRSPGFGGFTLRPVSLAPPVFHPLVKLLRPLSAAEAIAEVEKDLEHIDARGGLADIFDVAYGREVRDIHFWQAGEAIGRAGCRPRGEL